MLILISVSLVTLSLFLATAVALLFVEIVAATALPRQGRSVTFREASARRIAVLVPAHNESVGLLPTLADIKAQLSPKDQLLVVADNCTDDTAAIALAAGANVSCRHDPDRRGKGYALAWGVRYLQPDPPDIVIVLDADCRLADAAISRLAEACSLTGRPVQALDLMVAPPGATVNYRVMEFTWRVKNWVRPLGLKAIGMPCQLMGTGMAFPWDVMRSANLASGSIVEDLKLGLDFAVARNPPLFCPSAIVTSEFPSSAEGVQSQRLRWEQGHIGMTLSATPGLIFKALKQGNVHLLILALDAAVPPLSLLGVLAVGSVAITGVAAAFGVSSTALAISSASLTGFLCAIFLSWVAFGRDIVPPSQIFAICSYVIKKLPLYHKILFRKSAGQWIRTDRGKV
jgi:cellulose synthase/poly-beta-1,6-N-acetylglucosamine synthase-like glycosyltransferase